MQHFSDPSFVDASSAAVARFGLSKRSARVHVLLEDRLIREVIAIGLTLEGFSVTCSSEWARFRDIVETQQPHLVVTSVTLAGENSLELLRAGLPRGLLPKAIVVAEAPTTEEVVAAMKAGALDVMTVPIDLQRLVTSAREAVGKGGVGYPNASSAIQNMRAVGLSSLTSREREVLELLTSGSSSKQIARSLGVSPRTVESHRSHILSKMHAKDTPDLMRKVFSS